MKEYYPILTILFQFIIQNIIYDHEKSSTTLIKHLMSTVYKRKHWGSDRGEGEYQDKDNSFSLRYVLLK